MAQMTAFEMATRLSTALREHWQRAWSAEDSRRQTVAVAAALSAHLLMLLTVTGALTFPVWLLPSAPPPGVGDPAGVPDGVNVETIDAAEYDRRYVSFKAGHDSSDTEPVEAQPPQPDRPPQTPKTATPKAEPPPPPDAAPSPAPAQTLSEADVAEILAATRRDLETYVEATSKASIANAGVANEFVRSVLRILKQSMPKPKNMTGSVVIRLVIGASGDVEWIAVVKPSTHPELDRLVIEKVRTTHLVVPAKNAKLQDRTFQITYEYY